MLLFFYYLVSYIMKSFTTLNIFFLSKSTSKYSINSEHVLLILTLLLSPIQIAEFDTPSVLLANPDSKFSKMLDAAKVNRKDLTKFGLKDGEEDKIQE